MNLELLKYLRSKIVIILGIAVVVSALLVLEKSLFTDFQIQHGNYASEIVLKVDIPNSGYYDKTLNYEVLLTSSTMANKFFDINEKKSIDLTGINKNFEHYSQNEKRAWFQRNLKIKNLGDNTVQIDLSIPPDTPSDMNYLDKNFKNYYMNYVQVISDEIRAIEPGSNARIISTLEDTPEFKEVSRMSVLIKYGVIGFIMGGILACIILGAYKIRGYYAR